jgi:hypothetical protein
MNDHSELIFRAWQKVSFRGPDPALLFVEKMQWNRTHQGYPENTLVFRGIL